MIRQAARENKSSSLLAFREQAALLSARWNGRAEKQVA
jgi:hypothetical protein